MLFFKANFYIEPAVNDIEDEPIQLSLFFIFWSVTIEYNTADEAN